MNRRRRVPRQGPEHSRRSATNGMAPFVARGTDGLSFTMFVPGLTEEPVKEEKPKREISPELEKLIKASEESRNRRAAMRVVLRQITKSFEEIGAKPLEIADLCDNEAQRYRHAHEADKALERRKRRR